MIKKLLAVTGGLAWVAARCFIFAEQPPPAPAAAPAARPVVDGLSDAELQEALHLLKTNYFNPAALSDEELNRATLEGLLARLGPGAAIFEPGLPAKAESSPFRMEILDGAMGYLRLGNLSENNLSEMDAALKIFAEKSLKAVILDLRATPAGGRFDLAAAVAARFCPAGKLLFSIKKTGAKQEQTFRSDREPAFRGILVALVDCDVAGAPEAVAAVLRREAGALLIGEPTAGQAVDYAEFPIGGGRRLKVAEALLLLPDRSAIFPLGVRPDLRVQLPVPAKREIMRQSLEKGMGFFVFEKERPRLNEAALVAGINPELDALEAEQEGKTDAKAKPVLRDTVLQRAVDFVTTLGTYGPAIQH